MAGKIGGRGGAAMQIKNEGRNDEFELAEPRRFLATFCLQKVARAVEPAKEKQKNF
jgi:hypothetical protein